MSSPDIWEEIVACRRRGEAAALATIISTRGSTPGKDPMKMLVRADGTFVGSVGGGCLEAEVWEHARSVMRSLRSMTVTFTLTEKEYPDSGLICGGQVTVFIEPVTLPVVHVFGAGHVGRATAHLATDAGFRVRVYDDRDDMVSSDRFAEGIEPVPGPYEETAAGAVRGDMDFVIVVTRGHHDDERVLRCLAASGRQPRFLGMIGSRTKRATLLAHLGAAGVDRPWLERIVSPVGLPIGARTAPEIAVSIVAQLIAECRSEADADPGTERRPGQARPARATRPEGGSDVRAGRSP